MKAVFLGTWGIGQVALRTAVSIAGWEVEAVFTRPFDQTSTDVWRNAVWHEALNHHIPVFAPEEIKSDVILSMLRKMEPDLFLVAAFPRLLGARILKIPKHGALNLHGSLLPRNRGTSPVNWALIRDEKEVGLTMHYIDAGMDTGDIVFQTAIQVRDEDTLGVLADRIKAFAPEMIVQALTMIRDGEVLPRHPQDHIKATLAPRLHHQDCRINWSLSARQVWSLIRGTAQPNLGAWTTLSGRELVIWQAVVDEDNPTSDRWALGTVISVDDTFVVVACGTGAIRVAVSQLEWRREKGLCTLRAGDVLENVNAEN